MPRPASGNVRINMLINPKVLAALKVLAKRRNTTFSELLRDASEEYVRREVAKLKEERANASG